MWEYWESNIQPCKKAVGVAAEKGYGENHSQEPPAEPRPEPFLPRTKTTRPLERMVQTKIALRT